MDLKGDNKNMTMLHTCFDCDCADCDDCGGVLTVSVTVVTAAVGLIARGGSWAPAHRATAAGQTTIHTYRVWGDGAPRRYLQRIP